MTYFNAAEFCGTSGSKIGWISLSDAQSYAKDIFSGNITGYPVVPPFIFWTGIVRINDSYFQNDTQVLKLDEFPETEFLSTIISGNGYRDIRHGQSASASPCSHGVVSSVRLDSQKDLDAKLTNRHDNYSATCFCKVFGWAKLFHIRNGYKFFTV